MRSWVRTYIITPPFSAICFASFWLSGLVSSWFDGSGNRSHGIARFWSRMLLRTAGVRVVAEGLDRLPADGAFVYVSNHLSLADTPLMAGWLPHVVPVSCQGIADEGADHRRPSAAWRGHIPVERNDARAAVRSLARAEKLLRDARVSILVFAEGTRSQGGDLQAFKSRSRSPGAIKSGAPVVPIAVYGTADVMPKGRKLLRPGVIRLLAGDPIPTAGLKANDRDRFTQGLQARVSELMDRVVQIPS
jgi:1-acyl-sn-glycerol-3-phosphate acyltransferase